MRRFSLTQHGKRMLAGGLLALTLALIGGVAVGAASGTPKPANAAGAHRIARHQLRKDELQAAAKEFGIADAQLTQDLKGGKSLADEAASHNVSTADLKATLRATLKADLDKAVAAKTITQAREDKALAAFDAHADTLINHHRGQKAKP